MAMCAESAESPCSAILLAEAAISFVRLLMTHFVASSQAIIPIEFWGSLNSSCFCESVAHIEEQHPEVNKMIESMHTASALFISVFLLP